MKALPLFVQTAPRDAAIDDAALPHISIFDKHVGEWRKIVLVCGEGKNLVENTIEKITAC